MMVRYIPLLSQRIARAPILTIIDSASLAAKQRQQQQQQQKQRQQRQRKQTTKKNTAKTTTKTNTTTKTTTTCRQAAAPCMPPWSGRCLFDSIALMSAAASASCLAALPPLPAPSSITGAALPAPW